MLLSILMRWILPHIGKFTLYVVSGGTAAVFDIGTYFLLLYLGAWYIAANIAGGVLGFLVAFLLHKYVVFQKKDTFMKHLSRYAAVEFMNLLIVTFLLYLLVDAAEVDPRLAKFIAVAPVVLWNFFVYKFVVYV